MLSVEQGCLEEGFQEPNPHWTGNPEMTNGIQRRECWLTPQSAGSHSFSVTVLLMKFNTDKHNKFVQVLLKGVAVFQTVWRCHTNVFEDEQYNPHYTILKTYFVLISMPFLWLIQYRHIFSVADIPSALTQFIPLKGMNHNMPFGWIKATISAGVSNSPGCLI